MVLTGTAGFVDWTRVTGSIPARYRFVIDDDDTDGGGAAVQFIIHQDIYKHPDNHFWLRAALHMAATSDLKGRTASQVERLLTRLMGFATDVTRSDLGKVRCEGAADFQSLISALASEQHRARLERTLSEETDKLTPQSDSSIAPVPKKIAENSI
jgi:hypothetical protein